MNKKIIAFALSLGLILNSSMIFLGATNPSTSKSFNPTIIKTNDIGVSDGWIF